MPSKHPTSRSSGDVDDEQPANSPLRLNELKQKIQSDPLWARLWQRFLRGESEAAELINAELDYRTSGKRNAIIEIFGPPGIGKSMVALRFYVNIRRRLSARNIRNPFALTWNYAETKDEVFKYDGRGDRVTVLQDEDELMTGPDKEIARRAYVNYLKRCRKTGHNHLKCDAGRDPGIRKFVSFPVEIWGQIENYLITMLYDNNDTPLDFLKVRYPSKALRDWYEKQKDKSLHRLSKEGGNVGVQQTDDDDNSRKIYAETIKKYSSVGRLRLDHFITIARQLFGGRGVDNCKRWAGLAYANYDPRDNMIRTERENRSRTQVTAKTESELKSEGNGNFVFDVEKHLKEYGDEPEWPKKVECYRRYYGDREKQKIIARDFNCSQAVVSKWIDQITYRLGRDLGLDYEVWFSTNKSKRWKNYTYFGGKGQQDAEGENPEDGTMEVISLKCYQDERPSISLTWHDIAPEVERAKQLRAEGKTANVRIILLEYTRNTEQEKLVTDFENQEPIKFTF